MFKLVVQTENRENVLASKIKSQPTIAYFILAFLISWTIWFIAPLSGGNSSRIYGLAVFIGACGPVFAAFIVASTLNHEPSNAPRRKRLTTFATVFAVTYLLPPLLALFVTRSFGPVVLLASVVYAAVASYVVSSVYHPNQGIATVMAGLKRVQLRSVWVWVAVLLPFAWRILAGGIVWGLGGKGLLTLSGSSLLLALVAYPTTFFWGGPLSEEPGWRGFATPRLEARYTPLATGLIIGVIWSCWHFPLYFTPLYGGGLIPFLFRFVYNVPFGVIFTWLYTKSSGNLFASMLLHCSINTSASLFGPTAELVAILLMIVTAVFVAVHAKMNRKTANPLEQQMVKASSSEEGSSKSSEALRKE
jgi:membrane protease YdiL (CAAX protease family)